MRNSFTPDEFRQLRKPWSDRERELVDNRIKTNLEPPPLKEFSSAEASLMKAILDVLIPQAEGVDLVSFLDREIHNKLGRGDKEEGLPDAPDLMHAGLVALNDSALEAQGSSFLALQPSQKEALLRECQEGKLKGKAWANIPSKTFFERFYGRALHGYYSHPSVWMRIGFMGPAYPEGYAWLGLGEVKQRHERAAGWEVM